MATGGRLARGRRCPLKAEGGFTLIELLIVVVIGMILIGAIYAVYSAQERSFSAQDQVAEMNSSSRIALEIVANGIREMGFGLPSREKLSDVGGVNGYTNVLTVTDSATAPDTLTIVGGFTKVGTLCEKVGGGAIGPDDKSLRLVPLPNVTTIDLNNGDKKYVNFAGYAFGVVTAGGGGAFNITLQSGIGKSFPKYSDLNGNGACDDGEGVPVYLVENQTFEVVNDATCGCRVLQRVRRRPIGGGGTPDVEVLTQYVEDFQVAYGVDTNNDGVVDDFRYSPPNNGVLNVSLDKVLKIRLNLLVRSGRPDLSLQAAALRQNPPALIENNNNHPATNDNFRRRWWQMEIDLRNPS